MKRARAAAACCRRSCDRSAESPALRSNRVSHRADQCPYCAYQYPYRAYQYPNVALSVLLSRISVRPPRLLVPSLPDVLLVPSLPDVRVSVGAQVSAEAGCALPSCEVKPARVHRPVRRSYACTRLSCSTRAHACALVGEIIADDAKCMCCGAHDQDEQRVVLACLRDDLQSTAAAYVRTSLGRNRGGPLSPFGCSTRIAIHSSAPHGRAMDGQRLRALAAAVCPQAVRAAANRGTGVHLAVHARPRIDVALQTADR